MDFPHEGTLSKGATSNDPTSTDPHLTIGTRQPLHKPWQQSIRCFKIPSYRYYWLGMVSQMAAMQAQMMARGYYVYDMTDHNASILGLVSAGQAIPMLSLGLFGGAIADRVERKRLVQAGQAGTVVIALIVLAGITTETISWEHLMVTAILQGTFSAFMMPAQQALVPQLVPKLQLPNAIAMNASGINASMLVAPAVAGALYAMNGPLAAYCLVGALSCNAVLMTNLIPTPPATPHTQTGAVIKDIKDGISYVKRTPVVLTLLLLAAFTTTLSWPFRFILPVFVVDIYHRGPGDMGLLLAVLGIGAVMASVFVASIGRWHRGIVLLSFSFIAAISLITLAAVPYYFFAVGVMFILGIGDGGRSALNQTLIIEFSDDTYRGRVWSLFMMNLAMMPLGAFPAGITAEHLGGRAVAGILGALIVVSVTLFFVTQKRLRDLN